MKLSTLSAFAVLVLAWASPAMAVELSELSTVNLREGVTEISREIFDLHMFAFWVCVGIGVVVYGVMVWSLITGAKRKKAAKFSHSTVAEVIWTVIPILIIVVLAVPSINLMSKMYDTSEAEIDILVTGYQWKWQYEYLEENVSFFSNLNTPIEERNNGTPDRETYLLEVDNELVVPVNKKIRFLVTSADVIHSWWVPDFAVKRDAIPGYVNEAWTRIEQPGLYRGMCTELCGAGHAYMPIVVRAVPEVEYSEWILAQQAENLAAEEKANEAMSFDELMALGEEKYNVICAVCHLANGQGNVPVFPALAGNEIVNAADTTELIKVIYSGRQGTAMQAFNQQLKTNEMAAVITYVRNAWGNSGSEVQPQNILDSVAAQ